MRRGDWMCTYSGRKFWPCDPKPGDFDIVDIAHHLSNICRFTGAVVRFYSVAQHAVLCAEYVTDADAARWALMHDASEAYLTDVSRPVKPYLTNYRTLETRLLKAIAKRYRLPWPMPRAVKEIDDILVCTERRDLLMPGPDWGKWCRSISVLQTTIRPWTPQRARVEFLKAFYRLFPEENHATV